MVVGRAARSGTPALKGLPGAIRSRYPTFSIAWTVHVHSPSGGLELVTCVRRGFLNVAAKVARHGRRLILRLPGAYARARASINALAALRRLPTFA